MPLQAQLLRVSENGISRSPDCAMPYQFLVRPPLLGAGPLQYAPASRAGATAVRAYAVGCAHSARYIGHPARVS